MNNPKSIKSYLAAIKNIGSASIEELVNERKNNGTFKNIVTDLLKRVSNNILNRKVLEALFSNALKSIKENQKALCDSIENIIMYNTNFHKNFQKNNQPFFPES